MGLVVGFGAEAVVGGERAEVVGERVVGGGAVGEDVVVEEWWEVADVDPTVGAVGVEVGLLVGGEWGEEHEEEDDGEWWWHGDGWWW